MICPHCERMADEIDHLRRELGLRMADGELGALMTRLGVTATHARILRVLYAAGGRTVSHGDLIEQLPLDGDADALKAHICRVRAIIGEKALQNCRGIGYALTPNGLSLVLGAIQPVELQDAREA